MKYIRKRILSPNIFDKKSFRTITLSKEKGVKGIIGCRKGFFDEKNKVCKIGTELQAILYPATLKNPTADHTLNYISKLPNKIIIKKGDYVGIGKSIEYKYMNTTYKHDFKSSPAIFAGKGYILIIDKKLKYDKKRGLIN